MDSEGNVWVALYGGAAVRRCAPNGVLAEVLDVPARQVTAVTLGGDALDELYVTTSRYGLGPDAEPLAGAVFAARVDVPVQPVRPYGG